MRKKYVRLPTAGAGAELLIVTAAWTGARWGEIAALQRRNTHLDDGVIVIDPLIGAMIESNRGIELGPPKTAESARTITLPPFLIRLLQAHLDRHDHPHVFTSHRGEPHRRSNFGRRALRPATEGTGYLAAPPVRLEPVKPCGVPEVGPGSLSRGDRWSDMTPACRCSCCT
jgi:integrase